MNSRLKELRKKLNLTQAEFSDKINISRSHLSGLENGTRSFADRVISDICRVFNVNECWFRNEEGDMFINILDEFDADDEIKEFVDIYMKLDEDSKKYFKEIMLKTINAK